MASVGPVRAALGGAALLCGLAAAPAQAESISGTSTAQILGSLTLANTEPLSFGTLAPSAAAGSVVVSVTGVRTTSGGVTAAGGMVTAAEFIGQTEDHPVIRIFAPVVPVTLNRVGGGASMDVTALDIEGGAGVRNVGKNSVFSFRVGGTLAVNANQMPGTYTGTFQVTVDYF